MVIQKRIGLGPANVFAIINRNGSGLAPYTSYTCKVTASTQPGEGAPAFASAISAQAGELTGNSRLP